MALAFFKSEGPAMTASAQQGTPKAASKTPVWLNAFIAVLVLLAGATAAYLVYSHTHASQAFDSDADLHMLARVKAADIQNSFELVQEAVAGMAAPLQLAADTRNFDELAKATLQRHPGVLALGWLEASAMPAANTVSFTQRNAQGVFSAAPLKPDYVSMQHLQINSQSANLENEFRKFVGFDFSSDAQWQNAINAAAQTKKLQVSYQGLGADDTLLFQPVFNSAVPAGAAGSGATGLGASVKGYVLAAVSLSALMEQGLPALNPQPFVNRVFDAQDKANLRLLYPLLNPKGDALVDTSNQTQAGSDPAAQRVNFGVFGRPWVLQVQPSVSYLSGSTSPLPTIYAALIAAFTFFVLSGLVIMHVRKSNRQAQVQLHGLQLEKQFEEQKEQFEAQAAKRNDQLTTAFKQVQESELYAMQSEKMSSIGLMVAGVAHEINTPLGFVSSNVEMIAELITRLTESLERQEVLMAQLPQLGQMGPEKRKSWFEAATASNQDIQTLRKSGIVSDAAILVNESLTGLENISEIVSSLKDFSRVDRAQSDSVDFHKCIENTLVVAHNVVKNKAAVVRNFGDLPTITCNPSQINQVILNLVTNAAQAMDHMGTISLTTSVDGDYVVLDVQDNGPGMSEEVSSKIFEPFFTTKGQGEGTGLGLAICQRIITAHNGTLTVHSIQNLGATFTIRLPIAGVGTNADLAQINALAAHYLQNE